jgi:hypothetical protein
MLHREVHKWVWLALGSLALLLVLGLSAVGMSKAEAASAHAQASGFTTSAGKLGPNDTPTVTPTCSPDYTVITSTGTIDPGTVDIGNHCVNCTTLINLPFRYYLYNSWYFTARASSNGNLQFIFANTSSSDTCLPAPNIDGTIFGLWTAVRTDCSGCGIFTSTSGVEPNRVFNIEWRAALVTGGYPVNFEIRLYEGQRKFDIAYGVVSNDGAGTVVGVQGSSSRYTEYTCYSRRLAQDLILTFTLPECAISPTSTPYDTRTPTITRTPTYYTPTNTPIPVATCGPNANYLITTSTGSIDPGTNDIGNHCDDCTTGISLPFTYRFYGQVFNAANVSSNGHLQFSSNNAAYTNNCLPSNFFSNAIAPHWDDLRTDYQFNGPTGIYTSVSGVAPNRIFNIEWRAVLYSSGNWPVNFEIRLYEGEDRFDLVYGDVSGVGQYATVGVQRDLGSAYTQYECNSGGVTQGMMLIFTQPPCGTPTPTITGTPPTATATATTTNTPTSTFTRTATATRTSTSAPTGTPTNTATGTPNTNTAFAHFGPSGPITVTQDTTFTLDLLINTGSQTAAAQQSYVTFTNSLLQVASASTGACGVVSTTVATDTSTFDSVLQNEVCNSTTPCDFGRIIAPAGSIAFASGTLNSPPPSGDFRVAQVGFCANALGTARIHWQFSPPAPQNRDTEILDEHGALVSNPGLYADYTVRIVQSTNNVLVGHVTWQGRPPQPSSGQQVPITLTLRSGATEVNYPAQTTDSSGYFTVSVGALPNGTYGWRVKNPKFLANVGSVSLTGAPSTGVEMGTMRAADANNDNLVNGIDFIILRASFGRSVGEPNYDERADFNGDDIVNLPDFNLLKLNFGLGGGPPIR